MIIALLFFDVFFEAPFIFLLPFPELSEPIIAISHAVTPFVLFFLRLI